MRNYIKELLLEDNENMSVEAISYYVDEIIQSLKFAKITQKSIEEISLHEFKQRNSYVLYVNVIYNGDFEESFRIYRK